MNKLSYINCVGPVSKEFWPELDENIKNNILAWFKAHPYEEESVCCIVRFVEKSNEQEPNDEDAEHFVTTSSFCFKEMDSETFKNAFAGAIEDTLKYKKT